MNAAVGSVGTASLRFSGANVTIKGGTTVAVNPLRDGLALGDSRTLFIDPRDSP